ncbi:TauD/TfdA dioxygenase family protein [Sphingomonas abietis]|uniref:TauD/TfdA family dioxygenase n=1 Tax=Sphingomonas abietis TaxID=3012344 RepID=A0ABY7NK89_9SPHN|nr:TauD/TfdA family dioxygenase [Sphingomonas abietis]WBO21957.1 TauD/TfdA family dioxygenase [Sphingomonas abietis]
MTTTLTRLRTTPLRADTQFGAEIHDIDLRTADQATKQAVVDEFQRSGAILIRGQDMRPEDLVAFVEMFGVPEDHTNKAFVMEGHEKVYILSNRIGSHRDGVGWHTDYSYKEEPVMSTMLYAVEVPEVGGETYLADMVSAYNALPPERQEELQTLRLHHSWEYFMTNREDARMEITPELLAENPDVVHPLIRTHPADGRKALWVSTGTVKAVIGQEDPSDLAVLDELVDFGTQERFVFKHKWQVGDILMWDNRCTLHTGSGFDDQKYIRTMHRLWVRGDKPY